MNRGRGNPGVSSDSARSVARPILGRSLVRGKTRKRGSQAGPNFALNR
jgi:hypothetical protein